MPHVGNRSSGLLNPNGAPRRQTQRLYAHIDWQLCFSGQTACAHTAPRPSTVACTNSHTTHPQSTCSTNSSALDRHRHRTKNHPNTNSSCTCCRCCCQLATGSRCVHNWLQHPGITANPTYTHIRHRHCSVLEHSTAQHSMHVPHVLIRSEHTMQPLSVSNSHNTIHNGRVHTHAHTSHIASKPLACSGGSLLDACTPRPRPATAHAPPQYVVDASMLGRTSHLHTLVCHARTLCMQRRRSQAMYALTAHAMNMATPLRDMDAPSAQCYAMRIHCTCRAGMHTHMHVILMPCILTA
jgi:hypothetical protein